ncbi:MAG TPA: DUF2306 domain-containing protein [Pyrinomonadaceae bacterium]|nr:DUF2306 domain-containing protein [Pyrinomonadaceae bacterium]
MQVKVNAKYVVFTAITLATIYVLWNNERFVVQPDHPAWTHYAPFKWVLLPHALFGSIVLLSAPFQFSDRLRARFPKLHRIMGRAYILGVYVLAPTGAYIQYFQERMGAPRSFTILAIVDAALIIGTTTLAGYFAFKRKLGVHRQWATRSYAVALVFIFARVFIGLTGAGAMGVEMVQAVIWSCLVAAVPVADVALHWKDLRSAATKPANRVVAAKPSVELPRAA